MYGCDLLSAAQRSRKASRLEEANNTGLLADLTSLWEGLSGALVEARARLEVAQQFHHLADEVMGVAYRSYNHHMIWLCIYMGIHVHSTAQIGR